MLRKFKNYKVFDASFFIFLFISIFSGILVFFLKGEEIFWKTLIHDTSLFIKIMPLIGAGVILVGFLQVLVPSDIVARWLGKESGFKGILIATIAGAVTPGGPMISFPMIIALKKGGADTGSLIAYLTAWTTIGLTRTLAWEIPLMGIEFTFTRVVSSLILPVLAGIAYRKISSYKFFDEPTIGEKK